MPRSVVIVSPYFPPSQVAGVHRARHLANHLPSAGWTPIVLCVDEAFHEQRLDPGLLRTVAPSTEIVKVPAWPLSVTRPLGLGDLTIRAWLALRQALSDLLLRRRIDAVLITAAPYYHLLLAPLIKKRFGLPVVLDFQDPWVSQWGARQPRLSKAGLSHSLATWLEPVALRAADFVTSVSETQNEEMAARYEWLDRTRMAAVPIGGDAGDFEHVARLTPASAALMDPDRIELSYVGSYWPAMEGPLRLVLRAAARLAASDPAIMQRLRLNFIGTDATSRSAESRIKPIAEAEGAGSMTREIPERQPYLDALGAMVRSNGLLLIGSDEPHYTASKIYPALMSGRQYVSLFHQESSAHAVLVRAGGGIAVPYSGGADDATVASVAEALRTLATSPQRIGPADATQFAAYEAKAIAARYAAILELVSVRATVAAPRAKRPLTETSVR